MRRESEQTEWKVMIVFKKEEEHFHQLKLTKATEREMWNITFAKYLRSDAKRSVPQSRYIRWRQNQCSHPRKMIKA